MNVPVISLSAPSDVNHMCPSLRGRFAILWEIVKTLPQRISSVFRRLWMGLFGRVSAQHDPARVTSTAEKLGVAHLDTLNDWDRIVESLANPKCGKVLIRIPSYKNLYESEDSCGRVFYDCTLGLLMKYGVDCDPDKGIRYCHANLYAVDPSKLDIQTFTREEAEQLTQQWIAEIERLERGIFEIPLKNFWAMLYVLRQHSELHDLMAELCRAAKKNVEKTCTNCGPGRYLDRGEPIKFPGRYLPEAELREMLARMEQMRDSGQKAIITQEEKWRLCDMLSCYGEGVCQLFRSVVESGIEHNEELMTRYGVSIKSGYGPQNLFLTPAQIEMLSGRIADSCGGLRPKIPDK